MPLYALVLLLLRHDYLEICDILRTIWRRDYPPQSYNLLMI
jgi:hypothetical protein